MSSEPSEGLRKELLDDFYAECDELLTGIRRNITALEAASKQDTVAPASLEELFREMHSLKGICAIAGVRPAEELAHAVEDLLRGLTKREIEYSAPMLDLVLAATERLNKIIAAHRKGRSLPSIAELLPRLAAHVPKSPARAPIPAVLPPAPPPVALPPDPAAAARARGLKTWRIIFVPSAELDKRGVKINTVRERLGRIGEILSATPSVQPGGLRFIFLFASAHEPTDLATWQSDGVSFEPVGGAVAAAPAVPAPVRPPAAVAAAVPKEMPAEETDTALDLAPSHIVRVDLAQLDDLMRITGEIIIHRSRLEDRLGHREMANDDLKTIDQALARSLKELRAAVSRVRLVPVAEIFSRMPYVLRDLLRGSDKQARVVLEGESTEIDKYLVERLKEPLLHLVRNAFAHAIETPAERRAAGKPEEATIHLRAKRAGDSVEMQIADDGRGIDGAAVAARAAALGLRVPEAMDANGILQVIGQSGFSTRDAADRAAGRGVGMAVVVTTVRELGGTVRLRTELGRGSEFTLRLPLTLAIADALIINVAAQLCALPQGHVDEIFQVPASEVRTIQRTEVVPYRGALLPVTRLRAMFGVAADTEARDLTVVVVGSDRGATGLIVDRVQSRREIVIRTLSDPLVRAPGIAGATELGDGRPILVLDPGAITAGVVRPPAEQLALPSPVPESVP